MTAWGPSGAEGLLACVGPGRCVCPFISIPGAPPWVTVTPPSGRDVPGDSCWPWSGRSPALIVPLKQAGQSPVSSQPAAWALPGQGQGPECQLAVPERRLRFPASGRERALPKRAGSGSPCPGHGPVCTRRRPRLLSGRRGVSGYRPGAPASAGRVTVDTVVGTGDVGSLVSPRVRAGTSAGSALLTGRGGRRNPRAGLRAPPTTVVLSWVLFQVTNSSATGALSCVVLPGARLMSVPGGCLREEQLAGGTRLRPGRLVPPSHIPGSEPGYGDQNM